MSHERHHLPGDLKGRYVAVEIHPVQALDIKVHVTIETLIHCQRCSHVIRMTPAEHTKPARTSAVRGEASVGVKWQPSPGTRDIAALSFLPAIHGAPPIFLEPARA
jgi:hypothetical protein